MNRSDDQKSNSSFSPREKNFLVVGAVGLIVLMMAGIFSGVGLLRFRDASNWQSHSNASLADIRALYVAVMEAESNMRGYLNGHLPYFAEAALEAEHHTQALILNVRERVADNEVQSANVAELEQLIGKRFASITELIELERADHHDEVLRQVRSGKNRVVSESIRAVITRMERLESSLLAARSNLQNEEFQRTQAIVIASTMLSFLSVLAALIFMSRELHTRKETEALARQAQTEALEASKAKSTFVARMSHEIRTPMNGILGMAELILRNPLEPAQKRNVEVIHQSANALLGIINDILDLSKVESGKLEINRIDFSLAHLLDEVRTSFENSARQKNIALRLRSTVGEGDSYKGDPFRLRQILINLIENAIKFSEKGQVMVQVDRQGNEFRFQVKDEGPGMNPETLARLFTSFSQGDSTTAHRHGGTGLGLAICKELTELMGGKIGVESVPGEGSTFWFTLDLPAGEAIVAAPRAVKMTSLAKSRPARILVVEDNPVNQLVVSGMLEKLGHSFVVAADGEKAIQKLEADANFDLILMDCQMPVLDGYQATEIIRSRPGLPGHMPIIAVSANALRDDIQRCQTVGMNDFVPKPIRIDELAAKIAEWTGKSVAGESRRTEKKAGAKMVLNRSTLEGLESVGGGGNEGRAFLIEMLRLSDESYAEVMGKLRAGFQTWALVQMRKDAHKLKSTCGTIGADRMAEVCRAIEHFADDRPQGEMLKLIELLESEQYLVKAELEMYFKGAKAA